MPDTRRASPLSAIRTAYNGIHFRSRAEARWAAFFDLAGWEWEYEPVDLDGYIPDFILRWYAPLLVEVKGGAIDLVELERHTEKIEGSGWDGEALILAATPERGGALGLLAERIDILGPTAPKDAHWDWSWGSAIPFRCLLCDQPSIHHDYQSYRCRRCGGYEGDGHLGDWSPSRDWSDACNTTQWLPQVSR